MERRRTSDREYSIEDEPVRTRFCDERHKDMERRMGGMEQLVERLGSDTRKNNKQLGIIMGVIVFVGTIAGLLLQYYAIIHQVKP